MKSIDRSRLNDSRKTLRATHRLPIPLTLIPRLVFSLLLMLFIATLGGCSLPRTLAMNALVDNANFHPPQSRVLEKRADGFAGNAGFFLLLECHGTPEETVAWFARRLKASGWPIRYDPADGPIPPYIWVERAQPQSQVDKHLYFTKEALSIDVTTITRDGRNVTIAKIGISGYYWWDFPSKGARLAVLIPFLWMGEGVEVLEYGILQPFYILF